jgi:acetyltransferase-like isoleucine patch superfamily enzyme
MSDAAKSTMLKVSGANLAELRSAYPIARLLTRMRLWRCSRVGRGTLLLGSVWIRGGGRILVGDNVIFDGRTVPIELHVLRGAVLEIGGGTVIRMGCSIEATKRIEIGRRCVLAPYVKVIDNHFHPLLGDRHRRPQPMKTRIADDVVLGERSIVLPGADINAGARIGKRTVISRHVAAEARIGGNPPRPLPEAASET